MEAQARILAFVKIRNSSNQPLCALDATAGNGFDTLFLAELAGPFGKVLAIDLQESAIVTSKSKLQNAMQSAPVVWQQGCHSALEEYTEAFDLKSSFGETPFSIAMFNLGYLPFGDKTIITQKESTLAALDAAIRLLHPNGILTILSYPGHAGGGEEHRAVEGWISQNCNSMHLTELRDSANPRSPVLWLAHRHKDLI